MTMKNQKHVGLARSWAFRLTAVSVVASSFCLDAFGQVRVDLPYSSGSTGADGALQFKAAQPGLRDHDAAYYPGSGIIVFGGARDGYTQPHISVGADSYQNFTYLFDGENMTRLTPAISPGGRYRHGMAYDAANSQIVMFGGWGDLPQGGVGWRNDTWVWENGNWTQMNPADSPSARGYVEVVYADFTDDGTDNGAVYLFGGNNGSRLNDTWRWDGTNWTELAPNTVPPANDGYGMAFDAARRQILMYGGTTANNMDERAWLFDGTDWQEQALDQNFISPSRSWHELEYDPINQNIVMFGDDGNPTTTYLWDGTKWNQVTPADNPAGRGFFAMTYCAMNQRVFAINGRSADEAAEEDVWAWDGTNWVEVLDNIQFFDMSAKADGIWNYTTIQVPTFTTVRFLKNAANSPVQWLASGVVDIDGMLDVSGATPGTSVLPGDEAQGGPGGFAGGLGGVRQDQSGSFAGAPGQGPGGGLPGTARDEGGQRGTYAATYGNDFIQPLIGGSGGGGGGSTENANGGNGGGGGGAIMVSSSADIIVNGTIYARGGADRANVSPGGNGSGGAIRLVADRVQGDGVLDARSGDNNASGDGRIRIEGYFRSLAGNSVTIVEKTSAPVAAQNLGAAPELIIASVDGAQVTQPPGGSLTIPDVVFQNTGVVNIVVNANNIPDGTPVSVRITSSGQVIDIPGQGQPNIVLDGGSATFSATVPAGVGSIQAFAEFNQNVAP